MRAFRALVGAVFLAGSGAVQAGPPLTSIRPQPRPMALSPVAKVNSSVQVFYRSKIRPKPRDARAHALVAPLEPKNFLAQKMLREANTLASTPPIYRSPRPKIRPGNLAALHRTFRVESQVVVPVMKPVVKPRVQPVSQGSVCGDARIIGRRIAPIAGRLPGCGVANPVKITSIDGVALSRPSVMTCGTALSLTEWITSSLKPITRRRGGGAKSLTVISGYACRTRNSRPGAKISEHGKGKAIDISAINFKDGSRITVLDGWRKRRDKKILRRLHSSACGPFGTVLGPDANRYHKDHFHFDTARYSSGPYCR
ncbi:MAG: hypothetical protein GXP05_16705 [Alphaproteobacteria bacterium]|nr:hypothetical protein [Alphaproteobacteria bacterium]